MWFIGTFPPGPAPVCGAGLNFVDTRNCSNKGKKIGKLNIYTENGIFLWFLGVGSVAGNSDPGLGFFVSVSQCGVFFPIIFLLFCFESKKQRKNLLRNMCPCMWPFSLFIPLSLCSPTQTRPVPHTAVLCENLHQPGYNLFSSSSPWSSVFCWPEECG